MVPKRKMHSMGNDSENRTYIEIYALSLAGILLLLYYRYSILYAIRTQYGDEVGVFSTLVGAVFRMGADATVILAITAASLLVAARFPIVGIVLHFLAILVVALFGAANVDIAFTFGRPATMSIVRYAGLSDWRAFSTMRDYLDWSGVVRIALVPAVLTGALLAQWLFRRVVRRRKKIGKALQLASLASIAGLSLASLAPTSDQGSPQHRNAAWSFAVSLFGRDPLASAMASTQSVTNPFERLPSHEPPISSSTGPRPKNVLFIVLESVGQHYLDPEEAGGVTPNLTTLRADGAFFTSAYAHLPSSPVALYSLMSGTYPLIASETMPQLAPDLPVPSLISELGKRGFRTGFFLSANWTYAGYSDFLEYQGANAIKDDLQSSICVAPGGHQLPGGENAASRSVGGGDACTFAAFADWVQTAKSPFLGLIWTNQTHYPYRAADSDVSNTGAAAKKARYLEALRETDALLGNLVEWLKEKDLYTNTLIVIIGDHGEGFGQHGIFVHGADVYDEFMRVPLLFVNPGLFSGAERDEVVGQIDVAPTVMDALGLPIPAAWQGVSLFRPEVRACTFFAAPWISISLGYRCGSKAAIYWVDDRKLRQFDLTKDPDEQEESAVPDRQQDSVKKIIDWKNYLDRYYEEKLQALAASR
jgi:lipoteichoic acid synthase